MSRPATTFGDLAKGERFRTWRGAGTGSNSGIPAQLSAAVYVKVGKQICARDDGQWVTIWSSTPVERVTEPDPIDDTPAAAKTPAWTIRSTSGDGLYWSNVDGWTEPTQADTFSQAERDTLRLPIGGAWEAAAQLGPALLPAAWCGECWYCGYLYQEGEASCRRCQRAQLTPSDWADE